jgi:hypothetical protein
MQDDEMIFLFAVPTISVTICRGHAPQPWDISIPGRRVDVASVDDRLSHSSQHRGSSVHNSLAHSRCPSKLTPDA